MTKGKMVSVSWHADEPGAEVFTELYPTEILDIPLTEQEEFDAAYYQAMASGMTKTDIDRAIKIGHFPMERRDTPPCLGILFVVMVILVSFAIIGYWWGGF